MELDRHVDKVREQLEVAAGAGGEEARALAQRITAPLEAAVRLMLLDVLETAAAEITRELAPGSVELRLRGGEPEFVLTAPPGDREGAAVESDGHVPSDGDAWGATSSPASPATGTGEGGLSRVNLRLPDQLKSRVEQAAEREGLSINAWLVRAAAAAVERGESDARRGRGRSRSGQSYTGWGR